MHWTEDALDRQAKACLSSAFRVRCVSEGERLFTQRNELLRGSIDSVDHGSADPKLVGAGWLVERATRGQTQLGLASAARHVVLR